MKNGSEFRRTEYRVTADFARGSRVSSHATLVEPTAYHFCSRKFCTLRRLRPRVVLG